MARLAEVVLQALVVCGDATDAPHLGEGKRATERVRPGNCCLVAIVLRQFAREDNWLQQVALVKVATEDLDAYYCALICVHDHADRVLACHSTTAAVKQLVRLASVGDRRLADVGNVSDHNARGGREGREGKEGHLRVSVLTGWAEQICGVS